MDMLTKKMKNIIFKIPYIGLLALLIIGAAQESSAIIGFAICGFFILAVVYFINTKGQLPVVDNSNFSASDPTNIAQAFDRHHSSSTDFGSTDSHSLDHDSHSHFDSSDFSSGADSTGADSSSH